VPLAIAAALVAAAGWGLEARRAGALSDRVVALETQVRAQQAEIDARQRHLENVRGVTTAVEEQVSALRVLVERDPTAIPPAPDPRAPQ
jgi:hypothetical protein